MPAAALLPFIFIRTGLFTTLYRFVPLTACALVFDYPFI